MELGLLILIGIATILVAFGVDKAIKTEEELREKKWANRDMRNDLDEIKDILKYADETKEVSSITVLKIKKTLSMPTDNYHR